MAPRTLFLSLLFLQFLRCSSAPANAGSVDERAPGSLHDQLLPKPHFFRLEEGDPVAFGKVAACLVSPATGAKRLHAAIDAWLESRPDGGKLVVSDADEETSVHKCSAQAEAISAHPVIFLFGSADKGFSDGSFSLPESVNGEEHSLVVAGNRVVLRSPTESGLFYALQTLRQITTLSAQKIARAADKAGSSASTSAGGLLIPRLSILDWPDIANRGIMLDVSRNKVPKLATLKLIVSALASFKINQLQLYTEHTFAFSQHKTVWEGSGAVTAEEASELSEHAHSLFIQLVPNQQSFGHMQHWLKHAAYTHLAEAVPGSDKLYRAQYCCSNWDDPHVSPYSLAPGPESLSFLAGLYQELVPVFKHSSLINVGLDEVYDLGDGKSKAEVQKRGAHAVYLQFVTDIASLAHKHNRSAMFWGDVIANDNEGTPPDLPKSSIILDWGYEANAPFGARGRKYHRAGLRYYVCPGTSGWLSLGGRAENALHNILNAAVNGFRFKAEGLLATDWGDHGHIQPLPASFLGFLAAADFSWNSQAGMDTMKSGRGFARFADAIDSLLLRTPIGSVGKALLIIGNVFQLVGRGLLSNRSALFNLLLLNNHRATRVADVHVGYHITQPGLAAALKELAAAEKLVAGVEAAGGGDGGGFDMEVPLVLRELRLILGLMRAAARIGEGCTGTRRQGLCDLASFNHTVAKPLAEELRGQLPLLAEVWEARNKGGRGYKDTVMRVLHTVSLLDKQPPPDPASSKGGWFAGLLNSVLGASEGQRDEEL